MLTSSQKLAACRHHHPLAVHLVHCARVGIERECGGPQSGNYTLRQSLRYRLPPDGSRFDCDDSRCLASTKKSAGRLRRLQSSSCWGCRDLAVGGLDAISALTIGRRGFGDDLREAPVERRVVRIQDLGRGFARLAHDLASIRARPVTWLRAGSSSLAPDG
jgi:hypothetical protein